MGKARPNTPFPARPAALRKADAARGHPRPRTGVPSGRAPRRPPPSRGSPRPGRACPAAPPARRPARRLPHPRARRAGRGGLGGTDTAEGPAYLGGCWWLGSFPGGRGASGRGRGVRAQREKGGGGRPRPRQVAGWPRRCRRAGGSSGGSGDCSCGSLRIFLGQVQDGGAPCTGFPVTLAMGRTTKEAGGGECARSWRSPEEGGRGPGLLATPLPQPFPLDSSRRRRRGPPHWPWRLKGRRRAPKRKRSRVLLPPGEVTAQVRVQPAEVRLGPQGLGLSLCGLLTIFNASDNYLLDGYGTLATMLSTRLLHSLNMF